jgi:amino acid adenylation domain-containing protein
MKKHMNKQISMESVYWLDYLADAHEYRLPCFPVNATTGTSIATIEIPAVEWKRIRAGAGDKDFNVLKLFLAALGILLWKHSPQDNLVIAMPPVQLPDVDPLNSGTWFCKIKFERQLSVSALLKQLHETINDAYDNYEYDEFELKEALTSQQKKNSGLTNIGFNYNKINAKGDWLKDQQLLFELIEEEDTCLRVTTRLYGQQEVLLKSLAESLIFVTADLLNNKEKSIAACPLVSEEMSAAWFRQFSNNTRSYPKEFTVIDQFQESARKYPNKTALYYQEQSITYLELEKRAKNIACFISGQMDGTANPVIGILMDRSPEMVATVLGVLWAGAAYIPVDKEYPQERIQEIIDDALLSLIITDTDKIHPGTELNNCRIVNVSAIPVSSGERDLSLPGPDALAYVIYSSGTTGKPKGIMIAHRAIMNLLFWYNERYTINEHTRIIQLTNLVVDIAFQEIFSALINGLTLYIPTQEVVQDKTVFIDYLTTNKINFIQLIPDMMSEYLLDIPKLEFLDQILCGGDKLNDVLKDKILAKGYQLFNVYGQTETAIDTVAAKCVYGVPSTFNEYVPNYEVLILDEYENLCPEFLPGEICTAGIGLASGYLNRPDLTRDKFKAHPFKKNELIYHTGDIGKRLPDGSIEISGRKDLQVKIHGFRIELTEIEGNLLRYPGITEAIVTVKEEQGEKILIAYIVTSDERHENEYKDFLSGFLPRHMLPQYIISIDKMPLTPAGKVDRTALAALKLNPDPITLLVVPPCNETEATLQRIWSEALKVDQHLISIKESFFALGGDSIKAIRLISAINRNFNSKLTVKDIYYSQDIVSQSLLIAVPHNNDHHQEGLKLVDDFQKRFFADAHVNEKLPADWEDVYPMTAIQLGMVYHNLLESTHYFDQNFYQFEYPEFNLEHFQRALEMVIEKHEIFRTSFHLTEFEEPVQIVHRMSAHFNLLVFEDLSTLTKEEQITYLEDFKQKDLHTRFRLNKAPLWRFRLFKINDKEYLFFMTILHAIIDGWSSAIFLTELENRIAEFKKASPSLTGTLKTHHKDYVAEQLAIVNDDSYKYFWKQTMLDYQRTPLPFSATAIQRTNIKAASREIDELLFSSLEKSAKEYGVSLKTMHLAAYALLLKYTTGEQDITFGIETNSRPDLEDSDQLVGCFLNTIPFRINTGQVSTTGMFIKQVAQLERSLKAHDKLPLSEIVRICEEETIAGSNPFFDIFFAYHDFHVYENLSNLFTSKQSIVDDHDTNNFLFTFNIYKKVIKISSTFYSAESAERLFDYYIQILQLLTGDPNETITTSKIMRPEELQQLLYDFNATDMIIPQDKTVVDFFEQQVREVPEKTALSFGNNSISYKKLNEEANAFACYLNDRYRISAGDLVGIKLERGKYMIISLLSILKLGAAYVPLDMDYPAERIDYIVKDSVCKVVISKEEIILFKKFENQFSNDNLLITINPNSPAYAIYTSGSTGLPKGVLIEHASIVNLVKHQQSEFGITNTENILQFSSLSFDASVEQIFLALTTGACLTLLDKDTLVDMDKLENFIIGKKITHLHTVPKVLEVLQATVYPDLRRVISGGDKCPTALAEKWGSKYDFYNEYGPTETTVTSIEFKYSGSVKTNGVLPIGKPIGNTRLFILDKNQDLCPIGVTGELCIGGKGLAREYLNKPELTAEKFILNPFRPNERVYKTGDLAKWLPDGNLEFIGRNDSQVKIRGFRIELGEIENGLQSYPGIENAVAKIITNKNKENEIAAYITSAQELNRSNLKKYLAEKLPAFMLPGYYVQLDRMPLTSSGKIDKNKLPAPEELQLKSENDYQPPVNEIENKLVLLWQKILSKEKIGTSDNFFESGGHSLSVTRLIGQIYKELNVKLEVKDVFKNTTIKEQAVLIEQTHKTIFTEIPLITLQSNYPLSYSQKRLWLISQLEKGSEAYNISGVQLLFGKPNFEAIDHAFSMLIERHETLRTIFSVDGQGDIKQFIIPAKNFNFKTAHQDLRGCINPEGELKMLIEKGFSNPFDLVKGPLLRVTFYRLEEEKWALCFEMHHIISDGWSMEILNREVFQLYETYVNGGLDAQLPLKIQYKDYAAWQNALLSGTRFNELIRYWKNRLGEDLPQLNLPLDHKRPDVQSFEGRSHIFDLSIDLSNELIKLASINNTTLFTVLLAAYNVFLYKITNQKTLIVGTTVAGRNHSDLENLIGVFVNTLALKTALAVDQSFTDLLNQTHVQLMEDYKNQELPFETLLQALETKRDPSINPVFQTRLVLQEVENGGTVLGQHTENAIRLEEAEFDWKMARFELSTLVIKNKGSLKLVMEYRSDLFEHHTIELFASRLVTLLSNIVRTPEKQLADIEFLSEQEKQKMENKKMEKMKNRLSLLKR